MSENIKTDLILKLKEIFRSDRSDLDFGIYRILNFRRKEIERFIEEDLVKQAEAEFSELVKANFAEQTAELDALRDEINRDFPEGTIDERGEVRRLHDAPKIKSYIELKQSIADQERVQTQINEVFNHVYEFFSRYYDKGDFISQRRFGGREKYVIPHNGEEVSLYWVNQDQYYIKTTEDYRKYSFNLGDYSITFNLVDAESEQNNNVGADRFFVIHRELPVRFDEENKRLDAFFEHRPLTEEDLDFYEIGKRSHQNTKFDTIIEKDYKIILDSLPDYPDLMGKIKSSKHNDGEKPELKHHLIQYYQKNDMDYFIHKRLGEFLRRELDFYIKNEVLDLDETVSKDAKNLKLMQLKIGAIQKISEQIIIFLDQIENFQRKLFEKKKLILKTNYCMTLDMIPEEFYKEISDNEKQIAEWKHILKIDKITNNTLQNTKGLEKLPVDFLKLYKYLMLDTRHFSEDFKWRLLTSLDNLDDAIDGVLLKSENFQALNLLLNKYNAQVKCIYIDPPFNTGGSQFLYKNNFRHSSWCTMMWNVLRHSKPYLEPEGVLITAIDDFELYRLGSMLDNVFGEDGKLGVLVVRNKPSGRTTDKFLAVCHEYYLFYSDTQNVGIHYFELTEEQRKAYKYKDDISHYKWRDFLRTGGYSTPEERPNSFYPIYYNKETDQVSLEKQKGFVEILPIDSNGRRRVWRKTPPSFLQHVNNDEIMVKEIQPKTFKVYIKDRIKVGVRPKSVWIGAKYDASSHGTKLLDSMFERKVPFDYPKSVYAVRDAIRCITGNDESALIFDFFAGSGTTAHAVINLNRRYNSRKKYILVEMGSYFDTVILPRLKKAVFCETWKDGEPASKNGLSHAFKYMYLEQYEDTLNNILFSDKGGVQTTLQKLPDYFIQHVLDVETRDSPTRLTVDKFKTPFDYKIKTLQGREEKTEPVDLVETFNYLLGIRVKKIRQYENEQTKYIVVYGEKVEEPASTKVLIIWRNYNEKNLEKEKQFIEQKIIPQFNPDIIYVNVDSLIKGAESIEPTFKELMGA